MADTHTGTCFCGAVEIEATGVPAEMGYCHCSSCRSYSGGPLGAYILWEAESVRVTRGAEFLGGVNKTGKSHRRLCTRCGGHPVNEHPGFGFTHVPPPKLPRAPLPPTLPFKYCGGGLPVQDG